MNHLEHRRTSYGAIRSLLFSKFKHRKPGSLIRIGDGESIILNYGKSSANQDVDLNLRIWFGDKIPPKKQLYWLKKRLQRACISSSILGIPTQRQCGIHPRYLSTYESLSLLLRKRKNCVITDAAVHRFLHLSGDLLALLRDSTFLGLVTSQPVADKVIQFFNPSQLYIQTIPPEQTTTGSHFSSETKSWFDKNGNLSVKPIKPPYRGAPYLVGGGLIGKLICEQIRSNGGLAIDIGSVFDGWSSINTRQYFDNYPSTAYTLDNAHELSLLSDNERMHKFLSLIQHHEAAPNSFCLP